MQQNQPTKTCTKCKEEKPATLEYFHKQPRGKFGVTSICRICHIERMKNYYLKNKEKEKIRNRKYYDNNFEKENNRHLSHYYENWELVNKKQKEYVAKNRDKIAKYNVGYLIRNGDKRRKYAKEYRAKNKEKIRIWQKNHYHENLFYRLKKTISSHVRKLLGSQGFEKNGSRTWGKLPYTAVQLKLHLESLFEPWMTWNNYGKPKNGEITWHIDHIIPCAALPFDSMDHPNFLKCWDLSNLRPLCAIENMRKNSFHQGKRQLYKKIKVKR